MVGIMSRCKKCNIEVLDDSIECPLCNNVLDTDEIPGVNTYPDISSKIRKNHMFVNTFIFIAIVVELGLIVTNYITFNGIYWSAICGGAMVYLCFTLKYTIFHNSGHMAKIILQTIGAMALTILIDYVVGYRGWSVNYVIPAAIMLIDLAIVVLMIVNSLNWQSYIIFQIFMVGASIISVVLIYFDIINKPLVALIAGAVSIAILLGTVLLGDRRAINEINRRFRI